METKIARTFRLSETSIKALEKISKIDKRSFTAEIEYLILERLKQVEKEIGSN